LKATARAVAVKVLGRGFSDAALNQFVASFQEAERLAQTQDYNMAETGGTVVKPPDPTVMAEKMARTQNPTEAGVMDTINVGNEFFDLLRETD